MKKLFALVVRNLKETIRDPLSMLFCLLFPIAMLVLMQAIFSGMEERPANFEITNYASGICVFGYTFVALFVAMQIAGDKNTAFIKRLNVAPLSKFVYYFGFVCSGLILAFCQTVLSDLPFLRLSVRRKIRRGDLSDAFFGIVLCVARHDDRRSVLERTANGTRVFGFRFGSRDPRRDLYAGDRVVRRVRFFCKSVALRAYRDARRRFSFCGGGGSLFSSAVRCGVYRSVFSCYGCRLFRACGRERGACGGEESSLTKRGSASGQGSSWFTKAGKMRRINLPAGKRT